jgi:hypothetical protein
MMNKKETIKIMLLSQAGISVCLVTKLSKIAAVATIGTIPSIIFKPFLAPFFNDTNLEYVLGNKKLLPIIKPAAPAKITHEISSVPCIQITNNDCMPSPLLINRY